MSTEQSTTNTTALRVRVSSPNAPNPLGRYCDAKGAKPARRWKEPVIVEVVDSPTGDDQISHATLAALHGDEYIKVEIVGGSVADAAAASEVSAIKAKLTQAEAEIARLRADLAAEADRLAEERRVASTAAEEAGAKLVRAENEIASLRAKLAKRAS